MNSVPSPKNPAKRRKVAVKVVTVDQVLSTTDEKAFEKGTNDFTTECLTGLQYFGNDDISRNVDWTVIQGRFTKEDKELPCKMLVTRPTGMLSNVIHNQNQKAESAEDIYNALRPGSEDMK